MSAPVDVLASYAQDTGAFRVTKVAATELADACAAVAELIEACENLQQHLDDFQTQADFCSALARVKGA